MTYLECESCQSLSTSLNLSTAKILELRKEIINLHGEVELAQAKHSYTPKVEDQGDHEEEQPIKLMFAGLGEHRWCVSRWGPLCDNAVDACGFHIEDVFYPIEDEPVPNGGLSVFEGFSWWTEGTYEHPHDQDFMLRGEWRRASASEVMRFMRGEAVWP